MRGDMPAFDATSSDTDWIEPALAAGWGDYPGEEKFGYRRLNGVVYFKGVVRRFGGGGSGDAWAFLPPGFLPRIVGSNGWVQQTVGVNGGIATIYIRSDGALYLPAYAPGDGGYIFMSDMKPYPADH